MENNLKELKGANMDIDLIPNPDVHWEQDKCPWNDFEGTNNHKCAIKNISLCEYFKGIKDPDKVICTFNKENIKEEN